MGSSDGSIPLWIAFGVCLVLSACFSGTESALSLANRIRIKTRAEEGNKRAKRVWYILNHFEKALTTILVGNNVVNTLAASLATLIAGRMFAERRGIDTASFGFTMATTLAVTLVVFLFGEIIPKSFATDRPQTVSLAAGAPLRFLMRVLTPVTAFFGLISNGFSKLFAKEEEPSITEDELIEILDTAEEEGVVDEEQTDILKSALEFDQTRVRDVMTMAKDVEAMSVHADTEEILRTIRATNHSRIPVYSGSPDHIIGTLRIRRFLVEYRKNPKVQLRSMLSAPYFVREDANIDDVLSDMRQHKHHIAIVTDENKKTVGLATIEDFLEELVGEIFDEEDVVDHNFQTLGGNKYLVSVNMLVGNTYERMGAGTPPRGTAPKPWISVILERLGHLPEEGEAFLWNGVEITAAEFENATVTHVEIHILDEEELASRMAPAEEGEVQA